MKSGPIRKNKENKKMNWQKKEDWKMKKNI